jgi:hypothetical protein
MGATGSTAGACCFGLRPNEISFFHTGVFSTSGVAASCFSFFFLPPPNEISFFQSTMA